jgi:hypothetical protein
MGVRGLRAENGRARFAGRERPISADFGWKGCSADFDRFRL